MSRVVHFSLTHHQKLIPKENRENQKYDNYLVSKGTPLFSQDAAVASM